MQIAPPPPRTGRLGAGGRGNSPGGERQRQQKAKSVTRLAAPPTRPTRARPAGTKDHPHTHATSPLTQAANHHLLQLQRQRNTLSPQAPTTPSNPSTRPPSLSRTPPTTPDQTQPSSSYTEPPSLTHTRQPLPPARTLPLIPPPDHKATRPHHPSPPKTSHPPAPTSSSRGSSTREPSNLRNMSSRANLNPPPTQRQPLTRPPSLQPQHEGKRSHRRKRASPEGTLARLSHERTRAGRAHRHTHLPTHRPGPAHRHPVPPQPNPPSTTGRTTQETTQATNHPLPSPDLPLPLLPGRCGQAGERAARDALPRATSGPGSTGSLCHRHARTRARRSRTKHGPIIPGQFTLRRRPRMGAPLTTRDTPRQSYTASSNRPSPSHFANSRPIARPHRRLAHPPPCTTPPPPLFTPPRHNTSSTRLHANTPIRPTQHHPTRSSLQYLHVAKLPPATPNTHNPKLARYRYLHSDRRAQLRHQVLGKTPAAPRRQGERGAGRQARRCPAAVCRTLL